jgi:hypothetical protein
MSWLQGAFKRCRCIWREWNQRGFLVERPLYALQRCIDFGWDDFHDCSFVPAARSQARNRVRSIQLTFAGARSRLHGRFPSWRAGGLLEVCGPSQPRKNQDPFSLALGRLNGGQGDGVDDVINERSTGQIVYRPLHTLQHRSDTDDMCATLHGFVCRVSRV